MSINITVDPISVGPISFNGNCRKTFFDNQLLGYFGSLMVKLVRPVGGFTEQYTSCVAYEFKQCCVVARFMAERMGRCAHSID
jgi:hypothetical protein